MKKYLAAAVVAVMVFAFSAFAASLTVNGGTIQAGSDMDLRCMDEANVLAWVYRDAPPPTAVESVRIGTVNEDCQDGEVLHLILVDEDGNQVVRGEATNPPGPPHATDAPYAELDGSGDYTFDLPGDVHPDEFEGVIIGVDQGHVDFDWSS